MVATVRMISLWARDVPACTRFYKDILGLRLLPLHGQRPHFNIDGIYLTISSGQPGPLEDLSPERYPVLTINIDDFNGILERLRISKIELPWGIDEGDQVRRVKLFDPGGNLIELVHYTES